MLLQESDKNSAQKESSPGAASLSGLWAALAVGKVKACGTTGGYVLARLTFSLVPPPLLSWSAFRD